MKPLKSLTDEQVFNAQSLKIAPIQHVQNPQPISSGMTLNTESPSQSDKRLMPVMPKTFKSPVNRNDRFLNTLLENTVSQKTASMRKQSDFFNNLNKYHERLKAQNGNQSIETSAMQDNLNQMERQRLITRSKNAKAAGGRH
jgi:hypothetical protein